MITSTKRRLGLVAIGLIALTACAPAPAEPSGVPSLEASDPMTAETTDPTTEPTRAASDPPSSAPAATPEPEPATWLPIEAAGETPAAREDHTWTVTGDATQALLFGGRDGATVHGDLWSYDLSSDTWTRLDAGGGPSPRFGHEAEWVDGIGLVVFGGQAGPTFFNDLWAFDPEANAWSALPSSGATPTARYGSCMGLGPDGRLWISHGFTSDGTRFADTRAWDPATGAWTDETPDGGLPVNRCLHGCWWTDAGELALFGGQTTGVTALDDRWVLADGAWSRIEGTTPTARNLYARATLDGATLVLGGQANDGSYLADAWWLVDGTADATPLEVTGDAPPGRSGAELVVDADGDRLLLFGGRDGDGARADLWQLDNLSSARP